MPKFFVLSDIHGFYDEMIEALNEAGFDKENPNHWLIGCGDYFDRGPKPVEVMVYLQNLPRKILVRGNHEQLLEGCCYRGIFYSHDVSNGTAKTIEAIAKGVEGWFPDQCDYALKRTKTFRNNMVPYFETKNYIFVHSWIPVTVNDGLPAHYTDNRNFSFNPNWRDASVKEWEAAMWGSPYQMIDFGLMPDKTIVFGHWHCSYGWALAEGRAMFGEDAKFEPYFGDGFISIDGCTAHTGKVNVVVLEDDFCDGYF